MMLFNFVAAMKDVGVAVKDMGVALKEVGDAVKEGDASYTCHFLRPRFSDRYYSSYHRRW